MPDDFSEFPVVSDNSGGEDFSQFPVVDSAATAFEPDTSGSTRLNARFNNPGALGLSDLGRKYGATESGVYDTGHPFASFPTKEAGAAAQFDLWQNPTHYLGHTLKDAITNWIGPGEHGEAEYISQKTGIPLDQVITGDFLRSPQGIGLMQAQAEYEGANVLTPEQWGRAQTRAYKMGATSQQPEDFSAFPLVQEQGAVPRAELVSGPPQTPEGKAVSSLWPDRAIPSQDFSATRMQLGEPPSPPYVAGEPLSIQTQGPKASAQPVTTIQNELGMGAVQNVENQVKGSFLESAAGMDEGAARTQLNAPPSLADADAEIQRINDEAARQGLPTLTQAQMDEIRVQRKANYQDQADKAQLEKFKAQDIKPSYDFQQSVPGQVGEAVGGAGAVAASQILGSAAGGPVGGAALAAVSMSHEAATRTRDQAISQGSSENTANDLADKASKVALVVGGLLAAAGIHVPTENVVTRIMAQGGLTGTIMAIANGISQEISNDEFTRAGFPPAEGPEAGVWEAAGKGGLTGLIAGGIGAVGGGKPAEAPGSPPEPPEAQPAVQTPPEPQAAPEQAPVNAPEPVTPKPEPEPGPLAQAISSRIPETPLSTPPEPVSPAEADAQVRNDALYEQLRKETAQTEVSAAQENKAPEAQQAAKTPPPSIDALGITIDQIKERAKSEPTTIAAAYSALRREKLLQMREAGTISAQEHVSALQQILRERDPLERAREESYSLQQQGKISFQEMQDRLNKISSFGKTSGADYVPGQVSHLPPEDQARYYAHGENIRQAYSPETGTPIERPTVVGAKTAVKVGDKIFTGNTHYQAWVNAGSPTGRATREGKEPGDYTYGYLDQGGKFTTRRSVAPEDRAAQRKAAREAKWEKPKAKFDYEAALRGELSDQAQEASAQGQEPLLRVISQNGGLPTPARLKKWAAHGENLTGEMGRVYDAWKSLSADDKAWLKKQGSGYTDIFTNDAKPFDQMNSDLAQTPGAKFESPAEMLEQVEEAISKAKDRREHYAEFYSGVPLKGAADLIKGITKASQDFMRDFDETKPLGLALRRQPSYEQDIASRAEVPQLSRVLDKLKGATKERVIKETDAYFRALDAQQPTPAISPETREVVNAFRKTFLVMGQEAKRLGVKVQTSTGAWRDFNMLGNRFVPRGILNADTQDIMDNRNGSRFADYQKLVQRSPQIEQRGLHTPDRTSNATFANLERAREANLPLEHYDYTPYSMLRYVNRATKRLGQIRAYGQGVGNVPELFDRSIQEIEGSGRPKDQRDFLVGRVRSAQNAEYNNYDRGGFQGPLRGATQMTTAAMVGNPLSSAKYLVTGTLENLHYGGSSAFARAIGHLADVRNIPGAYREAENLGILRNVLSNTMRSYDEKVPQWGNWTAQQMLHYMGHNAADSTNRMLGMLIARYKLGDFVKAWESGKPDRFLSQFIQRRGIIDLAALAKERGQGPLSDEFVRQFSLDVHGSYGLGQMPSWMGNPQSRFFMQFMRWGVNASRLANQEHTMPIVRAVASGNPNSIGYQVLRGLGFVVAGVASGEITNLFRQAVTGRNPNDPELKEIGNAILKGNYGNALAWSLKREIDMMILGGFTGTFGEYYAQAGNVVTQPGQMNAKNPMHPPGYDLATNALAFVQGWYGENHFLGMPSPKLVQNLLDNVSAVRVTRQVGLNAAAQTGLPVPGAKDYAARNTLAWIRQREQMFAQSDPVFAMKLRQLGNRSDQSSGRTPFDPVHDKIQSALLTGDAAAARSAAQEYLKQFPVAMRQDRLKALQSSIRESQPLKPGGSISTTSQEALFRWARANLPPDEVSRMRALAQVYQRTAASAGFPVRPPP